MSAKFLKNVGGVDVVMPIVGLGTWQATDEAELERALDAALELGYRHIDTAYVYKNEAVIGRVLKRWLASGKVRREELFITTKLPMYGVHAAGVEKFLRKSLDNLQLDYVDLYLVHFPVCFTYAGDDAPQPYRMKETGEIMLEETDHLAVWKKMEEQVDAGRTKLIGLSNFNIRQIDNIIKTARIKPFCLQVEIHVYMQQRPLVDFCQKNDMVVVAYSPLGSPGYNKFLNNLGSPTKELPNILGDPVIKKIADKHKATPAQVALRFLIQKSIGVIPKSVTPERLKQNMNVFSFALDEGDMKELTNLERGESSRVCDFQIFKGLNQHKEWPL